MGDGSGRPGPSDSFVTLAALAAQVPDIRLGTLVTSATFRHPSMLAIAVAGIDDISGGRVELGLGSGWFEAEHRAYGLDFGGSFGERFDRLTEQLEIITGLWDTPAARPSPTRESTTRWPVRPACRSRCRSDALEGPGSRSSSAATDRSGPRRWPPDSPTNSTSDSPISTPRWSSTAGSEPPARRSSATPASWSTRSAQVLCCGRDDAEVARRAAAIGRDPGTIRERTSCAGTVGEVVDTMGRWQEAGVQRMYLQVLDLADLEHIALVAEQVRPAVTD